MISQKASSIPPFIVMDVLEAAQNLERSGQDVVHLEVGEPDFDTPEPIKDAAIKALKDGKTHYTHSLGLLELRETIAENYYKHYKVGVSAERVIVTTGTSAAMLLIFASLLNPKEEIILSDPHYACYPNFIKLVDGTPVYVNTGEADGFQLHPEAIKEKISPKTKAILINSPSNPTGALMNPKLIEETAAFGIPVISDEIYHGLVYEDRARSILEFTNNGFVINGFSKLYAMTGWRLGYAIVPEAFVRPIQKLQQNFFISAPSVAQYAAIAALKYAEADVRKMVGIYNQRRQFILKRLKEMGFGIKVDPVGAFYVLANAKKYSPNSYQLAFDILKNARVAVTPGVDFGANAEGYLRFSYANSLENIEEGMKRLQEYIKETRRKP